MGEELAIEDARIGAGPDPEAHVEAVVKASGTSFYWAMRRLPDAKRTAMYAIYAFCRAVDDIADDPGGPGAAAEKRLKLGRWRDEIQRLYGGESRTTTGRALLPAIRAYGLREEDFAAVIAGMEMDAGERVRISSMEELTLYCDRVACAVGRLSTRVFGLKPALGDRLAFAQGQALQLTNILRDVDEDAGRDRLYLPQDLLAAHGVERTDNIVRVVTDPALRLICEQLAVEAERRFAEALGLIGRCDRDAVRPAVMMLQVYHRVLRKLIKTGWAPPRRRVGLTAAAKLWVMMRYGVL